MGLIFPVDGRKISQRLMEETTMAINGNQNSRLFTTLYAVQIDFQRSKERGVG